MFKLLFSFLVFQNLFATSTINKSTTFSLCSRNDTHNMEQKIIVAMETLRESQCQKFGRRKAEQYAVIGWRCVGKNNEDLFSCENKKAASFANYNGIKLDHLTFTNLQKHRSLLAYINPNSNKLCHEDQAELVSAGVVDATCHKRVSK